MSHRDFFYAGRKVDELSGRELISAFRAKLMEYAEHNKFFPVPGLNDQLYWRGEPIEKLKNAELIQAVKDLILMNEDQQQRNEDRLAFELDALKARTAAESGPGTLVGRMLRKVFPRG